MTLLRSIVSDLIEKRLWPVAVALGLALVAVPVVVGATGGEPPVSGPQVAGLNPASGAVVRLAEAPTRGLARSGEDRNPFRQQKVATAPAASAAAPVVSSGRLGLGLGLGRVGRGRHRRRRLVAGLVRRRHRRAAVAR